MSFSFLFYHIVNKVTERSRSDRATSNEQRATNNQSTNLKNPEQLVPLSWFNRVIAWIESDRFKIGR